MLIWHHRLLGYTISYKQIAYKHQIKQLL